MYPLEADLDVDSAEFQNTIEGVTGMPFIAGNRVVIYNNGDEFYPAMLDAIESAEQSITMEHYIYWDGEVGRRFAEALAEKARQGVEVKLLLDAIGSATLGKEIFRILAAGGCQLAWFRPIHWYTLHRANRRDHRKSLIVDGRIAFTGGAGLADHWLGSAADAERVARYSSGYHWSRRARAAERFCNQLAGDHRRDLEWPAFFPRTAVRAGRRTAA